MKRSVPGALTLSGLLILAGCAPGVPEGCSPNGSEVRSVSISGEFGAPPEVRFVAPLAVEETQRRVISDGKGGAVENGAFVLFDFVLYSAKTGVLLGQSPYQGSSPSSLKVDTESPGLVGVSLTMACSPIGSRVVGLISPSDAVGPDGLPLFGEANEESLIFIVDIIDAFNPIRGVPREAPEGFPSVSYDDQGAPTVTLPDGPIPTEFALATVIDGKGAVVADGNLVVVQYLGVSWTTGEVFDSSWQRGQPSSFPTSGVIQGFRDGLVGQKVGSRVLIVIPPELGYGPYDLASPASGTILFVVDILGVQ